MESLYPPEDINKIRPATRFPSIAAASTPDLPKTPCDPVRHHDYVNIPEVSQQRYYVNVESMLEDPAVKRAREHYIAAMQDAAATDSVYANG